MENLFSYGTLQLESVQESSFGRLLKGAKDTLVGYKLEDTLIEDEAVLATSGLAHHPIAIYTGSKSDEIEGKVFEITEDELKKADEYEVSQYSRAQVILKSGKKAWVYVGEITK